MANAPARVDPSLGNEAVVPVAGRAGELTRAEYERWAQPHHRAIFARTAGTPRVLFVKECPYLDLLCSSGADVISLGVTQS